MKMKHRTIHAEHAQNVAGHHLAGRHRRRGRADMTAAKFESKFYKEHPLFSTYPKETAVRTEVEHFGPVASASTCCSRRSRCR